MRETKLTIIPTTQFRKDYKLARKRGLKIELLQDVIACLAMGSRCRSLIQRNGILWQNRRMFLCSGCGKTGRNQRNRNVIRIFIC